MTQEEYKRIYDTVHSIKRIENILWYMERTQRKGVLIGKKNWKFKTSYGCLSSEIELEKDEFNAIKIYLETKLESAKKALKES